MAKFRVVTTKGTTVSTGLGGYGHEMEALEPIGAEIVECEANEAAFIQAARNADAVYAKGMRTTADCSRPTARCCCSNGPSS